MNIEINNRLSKDLESWANANGMDEAAMVKYVEKALRDKLALDKYGDLNDKIKKPEPKEDKPKRTRTVKKNTVKGEPINEPNREPINEPIGGVNEDVSEDVNEYINGEIKPKRRTKVIASN